MHRTKVILERSAFRGFPHRCASCLTSENLKFIAVRSQGVPFLSDRLELEVPICASCAQRVKWFHWLKIALWLPELLVTYFVVDRFGTSFARSVIIGACLLAPIAYVQNLALGPVRLHKRANRETLTLWFANSEYARLFEAQNAVSHDSSPWARVL